MINNNLANNTNNTTNNYLSNRRSTSKHTGRSSNQGDHLSQSRQRHQPRFQNSSTILLLLIQLIIRLLNQLQQPTTKPEKELSLTPDERNSIQNHFGIFGEQGFSVIDKDGDNKLSAGDVVSISGGVTGGHIRDITVTQADVDTITGKDLAGAKAAFLENKAKWQANRPESYSYTLQRSGFRIEAARKPVDITVKGNTVTDAKFSDGSKALVPSFNRLSIDDLFKTIEQAIDKGAAEVRVEYNKKTGAPISIFIDRDRRIADEEVSLTASNFKAITDNTPQTLSLTLDQQSQALNLFGFIATGNEKVSIEDTDGSGDISVGDIATLAAHQVTLTEATVTQITDRPTGALLKLDDAQKQQALKVFSAPQERSRNHFIHIHDSNGDGKVSAGDVAIHLVTPSIVPAVVGYHAPVAEVERKILTAAEAAQINGETVNTHILNLSQRQHDAISNHFDDTTPLAYDGQATQYTGVAIDKDGDNQLSVGDVVKLRMYGGRDAMGTVDTFIDHVLTKDEVNAINNASNRAEVVLSNTEKVRLQQAVLRQDVAYIPGDGPRLNSVIDNDDNGKLSVGDSVKIVNTRGFETGNPTITTTFQELTQAQLDRYNANIAYNPSSTITLDADQTSALQARFNLTPGLSSFTLLDSNGDNKLSVGDQLEFHRGDDPFPGTPPASHILTAGDVDAINPTNNGASPLKLTQHQIDGIANRFNRTPAPNVADGLTTRFTGVALDSNGDGKLSAGDVVKLRDTGGIAGINTVRDHVLTTTDILLIEKQQRTFNA